MKLIHKINSKLVEGDFDVQSEILWEVEKSYTVEFDKKQREFDYLKPKNHIFDLFNFHTDTSFDDFNERVKYELEQSGFVKIKDGNNVVELHTPTSFVKYIYETGTILIYEKK